MASSRPLVLASPGRLPATVGTWTVWPAARIGAATASNSAPVCQAPWIRTNVDMTELLLSIGELVKSSRRNRSALGRDRPSLTRSDPWRRLAVGKGRVSGVGPLPGRTERTLFLLPGGGLPG